MWWTTWLHLCSTTRRSPYETLQVCSETVLILFFVPSNTMNGRRCKLTRFLCMYAFKMYRAMVNSRWFERQRLAIVVGCLRAWEADGEQCFGCLLVNTIKSWAGLQILERTKRRAILCWGFWNHHLFPVYWKVWKEYHNVRFTEKYVKDTIMYAFSRKEYCHRQWLSANRLANVLHCTAIFRFQDYTI